MKVTMLTLYASAAHTIQPGETVDLPVTMARKLIEDRFAVAADPEPRRRFRPSPPAATEGAPPADTDLVGDDDGDDEPPEPPESEGPQGPTPPPAAPPAPPTAPGVGKTVKAPAKK